MDILVFCWAKVGIPTDGPHDFVFRLFDDHNTQIGNDIAVNGHLVSNGLFSVELDFGSGAFTGDKRELEVQVNGAVLTPRQMLNAAPYAISALSASWNNLAEVPASFADNIDNAGSDRRDHAHASISTTARYLDHLAPKAVVETMRGREWTGS